MADVLERAVAGLGWAEQDAILARFADELRALPAVPDGDDTA